MNTQTVCAFVLVTRCLLDARCCICQLGGFTKSFLRLLLFRLLSRPRCHLLPLLPRRIRVLLRPRRLLLRVLLRVRHRERTWRSTIGFTPLTENRLKSRTRMISGSATSRNDSTRRSSCREAPKLAAGSVCSWQDKESHRKSYEAKTSAGFSTPLLRVSLETLAVEQEALGRPLGPLPPVRF